MDMHRERIIAFGAMAKANETAADYISRALMRGKRDEQSGK